VASLDKADGIQVASAISSNLVAMAMGR